MYTVSEVGKKTGITVRTLHYYDKIGLLKPSTVTDSGYRLYDNDALRLLQTVLMFKELGFSLAEIKQIIYNKNFDLNVALSQHLKLLKIKKEHIEELIILTEKTIRGENKMSFEEFKNEKYNDYSNQVKEMWGGTKEYSEYKEKQKNRTKSENELINKGLMNWFEKLGNIKNTKNADDEETRKIIRGLKDYITKNYYNCTNEILLYLGDMYVNDEKFRQNIDKVGGKGTAEFAKNAIVEFCK